jgi:hypothetical protein
MANYNVSGLVTLSELAKENNQSWWVYIVVCADHSFYTGITNDIHKDCLCIIQGKVQNTRKVDSQ